MGREAASAWEPLEARYSPERLGRLREAAEGLRQRLVSPAVREEAARRRRVTVGRTPLGECLRQLREAQEKWEREAEEAEEGMPREAQASLLNLLEKGLALMDRIRRLREGKEERKRGRKKKKEEEERDRGARRGGGGRRPLEEQPGPERQPPDPEETRPEEGGRESSHPQNSEEEEEGEDQGRDEDGDPNWNHGNDGSDEDDNDSDYSDDNEGDRDGDEDLRSRCDALRAKMDQLEEKVDAVQDVSQEEVDALFEKVGSLGDASTDIRFKSYNVLKEKRICVWSTLWDNLLQAVTALGKALHRYLPGEMAAFKKECNSLRDFLQTTRSCGTVEKLIAIREKVDELQNTLQDLPLKEMDTIKGGMDTWFSALLLVLLEQGQEKVDAVQEKVDVMQNIPLEQAGVLKVKMATVQKKMGALWKAPLKEMIVLEESVKLTSNLLFGSPKELSAVWKKACYLVLTLKFGLRDVPWEEVNRLWKKLVALEDAIYDIPVEKLEELEKKEAVLLEKVGALQNKLWNSLEEKLQVLEEKLHSLRGGPLGYLDELEEELNGLKENLDKLQEDLDYPLQEEVGALKKKMGALQEQMDSLQKADAPLEEVEEMMEVDRSGFSETQQALEAGAKQMNMGAKRITDPPASTVAQTAVPSSLEAANLLRNADSSSGSPGNLGGSVSTSVPPSSTGVRKPWHEEVTVEERRRLVHNFEKTISPGNDSAAARKKLEAYIRQIEEDIFEWANSKTEYHRLVVEKLHAIHKKLDQNLTSPLPNPGIMGNDQSAEQASWTQPPAIPPVAATTGQVQPLILPRGNPQNLTSTGDVTMPQPLTASCVASPVNNPGQMNNTGSVSTVAPSTSQMPYSQNMIQAHSNTQLHHTYTPNQFLPQNRFPAFSSALNVNSVPVGVSTAHRRVSQMTSSPFQMPHSQNMIQAHSNSQFPHNCTPNQFLPQNGFPASSSALNVNNVPVGESIAHTRVSQEQVPGAALPNSLNTLGPQNSQLSCSPVTQPPVPWPEPSASTVVGMPPTQYQIPLGMTPSQPPAPALLSTPVSSSGLHPTPVAGSVPDVLQGQSTPLGQTSNGSMDSNPNAASDPRIAPISAHPIDLSAASPGSSESWPLGRAPFSAARKRPPSGVEAAENPSVALQIPESTNLNRSKRQDPEAAMSAERTEDNLDLCESTVVETGGSEPPHKKQKMDPSNRTQMVLYAQELDAALQKYVSYITMTINQNMDKVGDLRSRLDGLANQTSALKDIEEAKSLTSTLKKALIILNCFFEDS